MCATVGEALEAVRASFNVHFGKVSFVVHQGRIVAIETDRSFRQPELTGMLARQLPKGVADQGRT